MLLEFLWDDPNIFDTFTDKYLAQKCDELLMQDKFKLNSFVGLVVHRLFVDLTA